MKSCSCTSLSLLLLLCCSLAPAADNENSWKPDIPRVWDEAALADWVTPLAGLNARPTHMSAKEYYEMPEYNLRSYPVYMPGREPDGYWEMLRHIGPKPLIEFGMLKTEADWIEAGKRVFEEVTLPQKTTFDEELITKFRSREYLEQQRFKPKPDGTLDFRWVPTDRGGGPFKGRKLRWLPPPTQIRRRPHLRCAGARRSLPFSALPVGPG